jgi:sulfoxide reductase heme-binding subunit YedZ
VDVSLTWVTTRAAGYTSFALLTASVALGLLLSSQWRSMRWPRFATTELHRFVTLLTLVFIAIHVTVALLDRFIRFRLIEVLVPFINHYRPLWTGLGIIAAYLATAVWLSTWLQRRIGYHWWRRMHYATFAVYLAAAAHGIGSGSDTGSVWSWAIYLASFGLVGGLLGLRLTARDEDVTRPAAAAPARAPAVPAPAAVASGPAAPAGPGWAGHAAEPGFSAQLEGRMQQGPDGGGGIVVRLDGTLRGGFDGSLRLLVQGWMPPKAKRLQVTGNRLYLHSRTGATYRGRISVFDDMRLRGHISPDRVEVPPLVVMIDLYGIRAGVVSGTVRAVPADSPAPARLTSGP